MSHGFDETIEAHFEALRMAEAVAIDQLPHLAAPFMREILGLELHNCVLTDSSELSDFAGAGVPDELVEACGSWEQMRSVWEQWVLARIEVNYGLKVESADVFLVDLLEQLRPALLPRVLH